MGDMCMFKAAVSDELGESGTGQRKSFVEVVRKKEEATPNITGVNASSTPS